MAHATHPTSPSALGSSPDEQRVREQLAARLLNRGVRVHSHDSTDSLGTLTEAVEGFEAAVEARGGDLMIDEPPAGKRAQPDNPSFVLPERLGNETADTYASRIDAATVRLRA